ncbi:hypothetical protein H2198_001143 [Neophaeococcomyces mojaviensis]|uniref:Uncharacterized protein n=1 Tax=Neophaeococcomyces mojaviensis TaxID=3383035 RepID=A0ACC3AIL2_9EURO|nr:hypothetical protein H2198_001143 [Knufia sp. JES_112]
MTEVQRSSTHRPITPPPQRNTSINAPLLSPSRLPQIQTSDQRPQSNLGPLSPVNQNGSFAFDRVIKSGKVNRRVKKKGAWKSSWKPAYLVLRPNLLSVYKDQDETELSASITLSDVTAVAPVKKSHHDHVFGVFSLSKNYHFSAFSAKETADWIAIIRTEARTEDQEDLQPPKANFVHADNAGYESTDVSGDEDINAPASPEAPHWAVRGTKPRAATQSREYRRTSGLAAYSGNEQFTTSQSDFSDGFSSSAPGSKGYLSSSTPMQTSVLTPIPDDMPSTSLSDHNRNTSNLSDGGAPSQSQPRLIPAKPPSQQTPHQIASDPSRVIRQGHLRLSKTISGVKQWKSVWMVLRTQSLNVYKSNSESSLVFIVPMYSIIEAAEIDRKHKQNCFQVICEEKTYRLQADSEDELESWLGAFKSVLVKQEAQRSSRHASVSLESSLGPKQGLPLSEKMGQQPPSREGERTGMTGGNALASSVQGLNIHDEGGQAGGPGMVRVTPVATAHSLVTSPGK